MFKIVSLGSSVPLILLVPLAYFLFHWCWHQWGVQHPPTRWPAHHCWQDSVPIKTSLEIMVNLQNVIFILIWMQTFFRRASANSCSGTSHCDLNCISFKFRQNIFGLKCLVNIALFTWCLHMDVHCQFLLHFQDVVWVCNDNDIHDHQCHFLFPPDYSWLSMEEVVVVSASDRRSQVTQSSSRKVHKEWWPRNNHKLTCAFFQ